MITRNQAEAIAARYVATLTQSCELDGFELELVRDATEEFDFGWLFYYNSSDPDRVPIAGNAPLIVERESGRIVPTGTAYPVQHYIDNYRTTGDPYGCLGRGVRLSGYNYGARKIDATKAIREHLGIGLGDAKQIVENCLNGASVVLTSKSDEDAVLLESQLKAALFVAERIPASEGRTY
ncbi:MAG: ribosomal protein L7/L12 [Pirellulales bacterium]